MADLNKPIKVKLHENNDRDKLTLGNRDWIENNDTRTPRKGIVHRGKEYTVEAEDRVVRHFLDDPDGGLERLEQEKEIETLEDKLLELPHINEDIAEDLQDEYLTYEEFKEEVSIEELTEFAGIGASRAEKIMEEIQ